MSLCINANSHESTFNAAPSCNLRKAEAINSADQCSVLSNNTVRFSLKKRKSSESAASDEKDVKPTQTKIRRTLSRCDKSFASLSSMSDAAFSLKKGAIVSPPMSPAGRDDEQSHDICKVNSLEFQLQCVNDGSGCDVLPSIVFPHLPVTVSESSSFSRAASVSDSQPSTKLSSSSTDEEEQSGDSTSKYGWFVVMDDEICESKTLASENVYKQRTDDVEDLAFSAPTAPKRFCEDEEAELAWAAAADVVDDVLGDLF